MDLQDIMKKIEITDDSIILIKSIDIAVVKKFSENLTKFKKNVLILLVNEKIKFEDVAVKLDDSVLKKFGLKKIEAEND